ncbi:ATP-dependent RNA helicase rhle-related protein [Babesia gibsoni]|uniref:RNA helicase n=1 Tax=Babesia gibsoni TaxID=33632 RepID=A0AAD8LI28_BABGI|nr:ATP-dependent RNA helicase rhle-related protein [Babesia gibsoni]
MSGDNNDKPKKKKQANGLGGSGAFGLLGLNKTLCYALEHRLRYKQPSAIQRKTVPAILQGRDVVCIARTGSGKTAAYLAPMVQLLEAHSRTVGVRCLILLPTRELALQVASVLKKFINFTKSSDSLRSSTLIGGESLENQFGSLTFNPDVVVATPGRLSQHLVEKSIELNLLSQFIIDEADKLFEMGFLPEVYTVFSQLPESRQVILVSATLPSELTEFVNFGLKNPVIAQVDMDMQINEQLQMRFIYARSEDKVAVLLKLLKHCDDMGRTIVFTATKHHVEFFRVFLALNGIEVSAVYGSMDMTARSHQMALFRSCKRKVLVVTDLAARGLDLPMVDCVINYDFPHSSKLFIHRVGRTARAGRQGVAVSIVTMYDFAFCFEIVSAVGRNLIISKHVPIGNEICCIGTLGEMVVTMEKVNSVIAENEDVLSLKKSMDASYNLYYKTRPNPSKSAVDRSQELIESMGGISAISNTVHPSYINDQDLSRSSHEHAEESYEKSHGECEESGTAATDTKESVLDFLHKFRPSTAKTTIVTTLPASSINTMERAKLYSRQFKKLDSSAPFDVTATSDVNASGRIPDFLVPSSSSNNVAAQDELRLPGITLNITPDSEELMKKNRFQRKQQWDPKKKKFVEVTLDALTKRVIKNESGQKARGIIEKKDLLKKWMKTSRKRIQKVGEVEDANCPSRSSKKRIDIEAEGDSGSEVDYDEMMKMFPKHAGTLEAAKKNLPMTNKQKRTLKRLTTKPDFEKMKPEHKSNKKVKTKKKRLSPEEFKKKNARKIAAKGAPSRSKLIVRKKVR